MKQELINIAEQSQGDNNNTLEPIEKASNSTKSAIVTEDINDNEIIESRKTATNKGIKHKQQTNDSREAKPNNRDKRKDSQTIARNNSTTDSAKNLNSEINRGKRNELQDIEKRKVLIVGDSQLRKISGNKLTKHHNSVNVESMPGAKILKMREVNIDKDVNVVIIHAGTCNIRKQTNPEKLADEIVSTLKEAKKSCQRRKSPSQVP